MTGITERIAEVQRKHREELHEEGLCICGFHADSQTDYPAHVASVLVAELGLTEEWGVGYREYDGIGLVIKREGRTDAEILNMEHRYDDRQGYSVVSRHATRWTPA